MRKTVLFLCLTLLFNTYAFAETKCFLVQENNKIISQEGECKNRYAPCCSFNIAISLMGYNEEVLFDELHPMLPFKKGYVDYIDTWKQPHNPSLWMKNSCVWYSRLITPQIGKDKFKEYITKFHYGNQDVSGDKGKDNGITHSWLSSSLEISPEEQVAFLQNLVNRQLPVSSKAYNMTKKIIFVEKFPNGWTLYGKTGFCAVMNETKTQKLKDKYNEWFVGWIEKDTRIIVFASYIQHWDEYYDPAGREAKTQAREKLLKLIKEL